MQQRLTQKLLKEYLHYNPDTGVFTNRVDRRRLKAGSVAGRVGLFNGLEYWVIGLLGSKYLAHRLAFLYMTGEFPKDQIDHEDGDGLNNRWKNLREATYLVNRQNQKLYKNNASGVPGVCWESRRTKWRVQIGRTKLGYYEDYDEAVLIRKQAEEYYGYHENHGRA